MKCDDEEAALLRDAHCKKQFLCSAFDDERLITLRQVRTSRAKSRRRRK